MIGFVLIGLLGLGLLGVGLLLDDVLDGLFDGDAGGWLSTPVLGTFLAAFGFGAALTLYSTEASVAASGLAGLAAGVAVGGVVGLLVRAAMEMPTDDNVRSADLVGVTGHLVTAVPTAGFGEVAVVHLGQPLKLAARASAPLPAGAAVRVTAVLSSSAVLVEPS